MKGTDVLEPLRVKLTGIMVRIPSSFSYDSDDQPAHEVDVYSCTVIDLIMIKLHCGPSQVNRSLIGAHKSSHTTSIKTRTVTTHICTHMGANDKRFDESPSIRRHTSIIMGNSSTIRLKLSSVT